MFFHKRENDEGQSKKGSKLGIYILEMQIKHPRARAVREPPVPGGQVGLLPSARAARAPPAHVGRWLHRRAPFPGRHWGLQPRARVAPAYSPWWAGALQPHPMHESRPLMGRGAPATRQCATCTPAPDRQGGSCCRP